MFGRQPKIRGVSGMPVYKLRNLPKHEQASIARVKTEAKRATKARNKAKLSAKREAQRAKKAK